MLKTKDLMELYKVSRPTISTWMKRGMPFYKIGKLVRFDEAQVRKWVDFQNAKTKGCDL